MENEDQRLLALKQLIEDYSEKLHLAESLEMKDKIIEQIQKLKEKLQALQDS